MAEQQGVDYAKTVAEAMNLELDADKSGIRYPAWTREPQELSSAVLAKAKAAGYATELPGRSGDGGAAAFGGGDDVAAGATEELGRGEFVGDSPTREESGRKFDAIRKDYEERYPDRNHFRERPGA